MDGSAEFASRDFSGFDLARLVRNFEIVAASSQESGQLRLTTVVLYLSPALAVNGAALAWFASHRIAVVVVLGAAAYAGLVLLGVAILSLVSWTELERVLGGLMGGFACSSAGALTMLAAGLVLLREQSVNSEP